MNITTAQEALEGAMEFCQDIGYSVEPNPVVKIEYQPVTMTEQYISYWKPKWKIEIGRDTSIDVDESSAISNFSLCRQLTAEISESKGEIPTKAAAVEHASSIMSAMRLPEEVKAENPAAELERVNHYEGSRSTDWWFSVPRTYEGIRVLQQSFVLHFNAETGAPSGASLNFHSFLPLSSETLISKEQAVVIAEHQLALAGIKGFSYSGVRKYVVQPNNFFSDRGLFPSRNLDRMRARVAWVCFFTTRDTLYLPYIDVQTSEVFGGDMHFQ